MFRSEFPNLCAVTVPPNARPVRATKVAIRFLVGFDELAGRTTFRACRAYADDFAILSRGHAHTALEWTRGVMTKLELTVNETKTSVRDARRERFDFLGYAFGPHHFRKDGHWNLGASPSMKSIQKIKDKVGSMLRRGDNRCMQSVKSTAFALPSLRAPYHDAQLLVTPPRHAVAG
jgi:RNA-directed DNA polymerase